MANNVIKRIWNKNKMVNIEALDGMAFQAEDEGHTFEISGIDDDGNSVALSGTVAGVFLRADNADIALTGSASDGKVSVTLTEDCYAVPGRFALTIFITADSQTTAVYAAIGTVVQTSGGGVAGDTPQDVVDLINAISAAVATIPADYTDLMASTAPTYSNTALYAAGSYAWYNGKLYRCTIPITTGASFSPAFWAAVPVTEEINRVASRLSSKDVAQFSNESFANTTSGAYSLEHKGINLSTGGNISEQTVYGKKSARTYLIAIPEQGVLIKPTAGTDNWVYSVFCYGDGEISAGNFVYSPTDKKLISFTEPCLVLPVNGAKQFAIQFRCLENDQSLASYGYYRDLAFEGETGVSSGNGDDTKIKSLIHIYSPMPVSPLEMTNNKVSPKIYEFARSIGASVEGDTVSAAVPVFSSLRWIWIPYHAGVPAGDYVISFYYNTGSMSSGNPYIRVGDSEGTVQDIAGLNRSSEWRHFSKRFHIPDNNSTVFFVIVSSTSNDSVVSVKEMAIVPADEDNAYNVPISSVDSIARNGFADLERTTEKSKNIFDLQKAFRNSSGLNIDDDNVISGFSRDFVSLKIIDTDDVVENGTVQILFDEKYGDPSLEGELRMVFCDSDGTALESVQLTNTSTVYFYTKFITRKFPEGTSFVRFGYTGRDSKTFYIKNIRVFINSEGRKSTESPVCLPINKTGVDVEAREHIVSGSCLFDGGVFRLQNTPSSIPDQTPYSDLISAWDSFMAEYPDQITREQMGNSTAPTGDPSETYPIYRYIITPIARESWSGASRSSFTVGYERTILLTAGCHGNEGEGYWGLLRLMKLIYEEGYKYPALHKLRNHVRYIILPAWNPYGIQHNQRLMANGGNPYSYFASEDKPDETLALMDTLDDFPELSFWLDFHTDPYAGSSNPRPNTPKDAVKSGCYAFAPNRTMLANSLFDLTCDFHNMFKQDYSYETQTMFELSNPNTSGHPSYGNSRLPTAVLEVSTKMQDFPYAAGSGEMMKISEEWFGNCLVAAIKSTIKL